MTRDDLLHRIRKEAARLDPHTSPVAGPVNVNDLLSFDGEAFVDVLYERILQRKADTAGKAHYTDLVKFIPKPFLVYIVSRSPEARQKQVKVKGVYTTLLKFCVRTAPSALVRGLAMVVLKKAFSIISRFHSTQKPREERPIDYFKFYEDFEEEFRGSEYSVEEGLKVYLPFFHEIDGSIVDLGSGRGECLRLLRKEGLNGKGVDINPYFIDKCEQDGLSVTKQDVFAFLSNADNDSIGGIICFHFIEHIDPHRRLTFINEIFRVLKPGGMMIIETPNPRNILVSAGDFWRDPDHITPVFGETLTFMATFVGFTKVEHYFFDEHRTAITASSNKVFNDLKDYVEVSRDYAVMARKL
jgi:SAM-dependent methyltransferase